MISGYLIGDKQMIARLTAMPTRVKAEVDATVQKLGYALQLRVQSAYLRGPRPARLGVKTGRLLRSITPGGGDSRSRFVSTPLSAVYYVGTNVQYSAGWEYGFARKIGAGARGGPRTLMEKALATYIAKHPPGVKQMAARPFLVPALADLRPRIVADLEAALKKAVTEAMKA